MFSDKEYKFILITSFFAFVFLILVLWIKAYEREKPNGVVLGKWTDTVDSKRIYRKDKETNKLLVDSTEKKVYYIVNMRQKGDVSNRQFEISKEIYDKIEVGDSLLLGD
jgi:hypothetical protein